MKRMIPASIVFCLMSSYAMAQDGGTGIGYIPGMPVPQAAPAPSGSSGSSSSASASQGGKVSKVSVANGDFAKPAPAPEPVNTEVKVGSDEYKGVTPPKRLVPENSSTFTKASGNQLSWIGFLPEKDGNHKIFLQTSQPTTFERLATPSNRVEIVISDTKLAVSNNNRELNMKYFQTPFATAKAQRDGKNVRVIVELKDNTPCEVTQHDNMIDIIAKSGSN